jgi:hypothetical protein
MQPELQLKLLAPFDDADIEWRLQSTSKDKASGKAVAYVTNRAIQNRLDDVVGVDGWKNEYIPWHSDGKKASQLCGISIYFEDRKEWVTKFDGAEDSDIEPVKGGLSDSMKRAAVQWGVGRYLYEMDTVSVETELWNDKLYIKRGEQAKMDKAHQSTVNKVFGSGKPAPQGKPDATGQPARQQPSQAAKPANAKQNQQAPAPDPAQQKAQALEKTPAQQPEPAQTPTTQLENQTQPQATQQQPQPAPIVQHPATVQEPPGNSYRIIGMTIQPTLSGQNSLLKLQRPDGKVLLAYMQGTDPAIAKDVWIDNAVITKKVNEGVVFYTLDSFTLRVPAAA